MYKQLPLPLHQPSALEAHQAPSKPLSYAAYRYIIAAGECSHCGKPMRHEEEISVIVEKYTGRIVNLRCQNHMATEYSAGPHEDLIILDLS